MFHTASRLTAATGAGLIAASVTQRYLNWVLDFSRTPGIRDWAGAGRALAPLAGLVAFVMVFGAVMEMMKK